MIADIALKTKTKIYQVKNAILCKNFMSKVPSYVQKSPKYKTIFQNDNSESEQMVTYAVESDAGIELLNIVPNSKPFDQMDMERFMSLCSATKSDSFEEIVKFSSKEIVTYLLKETILEETGIFIEEVNEKTNDLF